MSLIEGVDDEIVVAIGTFAVVSTAVVLAWRSTAVRNPAPAQQQQQQQTPQQQESPGSQSSSEETNQNTHSAENDEPPATGQPIKLKLKFLNDTERVVDVTEDWTIGQLKRIHLAQELDGGRRVVRLVFRGHELADVAQKISEAGLNDMATIHCLVSPVRSTQQNSNQQQQQQINAMPIHRVPSAGFDNVAEYDEVGRLLMPLLAIVLGCVWYARIRYRSLFDGFSSLALIAFTLAFMAAVASHFYRLLGFGQPSNNTVTNNNNPTNGQANTSSNENSPNTTNQQPSNNSESTGTESNTERYPSFPPPPYSQSDHTHAD